MKVYTSITWDFAGNVIAEESHDYDGPVAQCIAAAIVGGAVVSATGAIVGSSEQSSAANNASNLQQQQFNTTQQEQAPYRAAGATALGTISSDEANGTGFAAPFSQASFMSNPGYQFQLQQGQNAINSSAAANGGTLNGGTLKALDQYTTGLANTTYNSAYNNYLAGSQQQYGQLMGVAQLGENATASTGAAGAAAANASGNYLTQAGNAAAAGTVGVGSAINSGINNTILYNALQNSQSSYNTGYNTNPAQVAQTQSQLGIGGMGP